MNELNRHVKLGQADSKLGYPLPRKFNLSAEITQTSYVVIIGLLNLCVRFWMTFQFLTWGNERKIVFVLSSVDNMLYLALFRTLIGFVIRCFKKKLQLLSL